MRVVGSMPLVKQCVLAMSRMVERLWRVRVIIGMERS